MSVQFSHNSDNPAPAGPGRDSLLTEIADLKNEIQRLHHLQEKGEETERKYQDLIDGSKLGIMIHRDFNFIFLNSMFAEIFGYDDVDDILTKKSILNLVPAKTGELFQKHMNDRLRGRPAPTFYEYEGIKKDGSSIWLENVVRIVTWDGAPAVQITVVDITEQKRVQLKLQQSEERFRTYASIGADWMWETDEEDRFTYVSSSFYEKMEIGADEIIGSSRAYWIDDADLADHTDKWGGHFLDIKNRLPFYDLDYQIATTGDTIRIIRTSGVPVFDKKGLFTGYRGISRDITTQNETDRMKTEFVSTISHELRTPLTAIKGALGILASGTYGKIPAEIADVINLADRNASQLTNLVNDLLDMEKMQSNRMQFHMSPVVLEDVIAQGIKSNRLLATHFEINVRYVGSVSNAMVWGDPQRLQQALVNILSNATKFSRSGQTVTLKLSKIASTYRIRISDNGVGISDQFREKMFNPFTQADSSDTRRNNGVGLGLNIAKAIISAHNGQITCETEKDKGTTFCIDLPVRPA